MTSARTLYDKIWDAHAVAADDGDTLLYVDLHLLHEVTSPQAFAGLRREGRAVRRPERALALSDHNVPTEGQSAGVAAVVLCKYSVSFIVNNCNTFIGLAENYPIHNPGCPVCLKGYDAFDR